MSEGGRLFEWVCRENREVLYVCVGGGQVYILVLIIMVTWSHFTSSCII